MEGVKEHARSTVVRRGCQKDSASRWGRPSRAATFRLTKWLLAYHLLRASKKGMSAHRLHRILEDQGGNRAEARCHEAALSTGISEWAWQPNQESLRPFHYNQAGGGFRPPVIPLVGLGKDSLYPHKALVYHSERVNESHRL